MPDSMTPWILLSPSSKHEKHCMSYSSALTYKTCPRAYRLQHVERKGKMRPDTQQASEGILLHEMLNVLNRFRIHAGIYPPDLAPIVGHVLERHAEKMTPATKIKMQAMATSLLELYARGVGSDLAPVMSESEFLIEDPKSGMRIYGFVDIMTTDGVYDYKSSAVPIVDAGIHADQMHVYILAYRAINGVWPASAGIINLTRIAKTVKMLPFHVDERFVSTSLDNVLGIYYNVSAGKFEPRLGTWCRTCAFGADVNVCAEGWAIQSKVRHRGDRNRQPQAANHQIRSSK